jgi:hypothetical protein
LNLESTETASLPVTVEGSRRWQLRARSIQREILGGAERNGKSRAQIVNEFWMSCHGPSVKLTYASLDGFKRNRSTMAPPALPKAIAEPEELVVNPIQHRNRPCLDDLVFERRKREGLCRFSRFLGRLIATSA